MGKSKDTRGYIYVVHSTSGHYKIGRSKDPHARFKQLTSTQGPYVYTLVNVLSTYDMFEAEADYHRMFEHKRVRGEWFELTEEELGPLLWANWCAP